MIYYFNNIQSITNKYFWYIPLIYYYSITICIIAGNIVKFTNCKINFQKLVPQALHINPSGLLPGVEFTKNHNLTT